LEAVQQVEVMAQQPVAVAEQPVAVAEQPVVAPAQRRAPAPRSKQQPGSRLARSTHWRRLR